MNFRPTYKYKIGDLVFCKFRGKWNIGRIEFAWSTCGMNQYSLNVRGAKRFQKKYEYELEPTVELDENGKPIFF